MKKFFLVLISTFLFAVPVFASAPVCLYTDILSGPATGGEGGNGIYLTIFGKNFGATQGSSTVTVNGTAVAQYLVWGHDNDATGNLDQVSVQVAQGTTGTGNIVVTTPGGSCNNLTFTARAGNIYFVGPGIDNDIPGNGCAAIKNGTAGNGAGGSGTFASPWTLTNQQNIDTVSEDQQAYTPATRRTPHTYYGCLAAGDTLVFLGGVSFKYADGENWHSSLTLDLGKGSENAPLTFMARPGASVQLGSQGNTAYGIRAPGEPNAVISGLSVTGSGMDGSGLQFNTTGLRLVGNTITCPDCSASSAALEGGEESDNTVGGEILGNAVTDVACSDAGGVSNKQYHDMYFFGNGFEVGWNKIYNGCAYNGIQVNYFTDASIGFGNLSIHDNDISGANGAGINMASVDPSQGPINIYNNLIHHVGLQPASDGSSFHSCIAFPGEAPSAAPGAVNVYNNTMYDCSSYLNTVSDPSSCTVYMVYETAQKGLAVNLVNNIMAQPAYTYTSKQSVYLCGGGVNSMLGGMNNLFYSASTPGSIYDAMTVGSINNPLFVSTTAGSLNLNLTSNSPAIGAGSASLYSPLDFNGVTRPNPSAIGAFEYGSPSGEQITVSAAPNPATAEEPVTLTATVAQTGSLVPTGSIDFLNAGVSLGQASLNGEGTATLVVSSLSAGSYAVIASYSGDSNYPAGESGAVSLEVQSDTTTTLVATPNPVTAGQALTLTATVAGSGGTTPAGTVSFMSGSTLLGTGTLNSSGVGTLSTAALAAGTYSLTAQYAGNASSLASTSSAVSVTVTTATQSTTTTLVATPNPVTAGQVLTLTATVADSGGSTPAGTVSFMNGSTLLGTGTLNSSGVGTLSTAALAAGTYSLTAQYAGNASSLASTSSAVSVTVTPSSAQSTTTTLVATPNPVTAGQALTLTATVAGSGGSTPAGTVSFMNGSTLLGTVALNSSGVATVSTAALAAGTYSLTAQYAGNASSLASTSSAVSVTVTTATQSTTTTLVASSNPVTAGMALVLTTNVKGNGSATPAGTVTFTDSFNGETVTLGSAALGTAGTATLKPTLAVGSHLIVAAYAGHADDKASASAPLALAIQLATTSTVVTSASDTSVAGSAVTFAATVTGNAGTPTGGVSFLANGTIALGTASLDASAKAQVTYSALAVGSYQITAVYAGDSNNLASTAPAISHVVGPIPTTTDLSTAPTNGANSQSTLVANVQDSGAVGTMPTGTVTFTSGTTMIGAVAVNADGVATLTPALGSGSYYIVAAYSGDSLHSPSTSSAMSVNSVASSFSIGITPAAVTMAVSQSATVNVSLNSINGFTDKISLRCDGLPPGVNCDFSSISVSLGANGTQTAQLVINSQGGGSSAMNKRLGKRDADLAGLFLPFGLLLGWRLWSFRKRHAGALSTLLIIILTGTAMLATGCGGFIQRTAAPGTYVIQVAGLGTNTNTAQYQSFTLNITK